MAKLLALLALATLAFLAHGGSVKHHSLAVTEEGVQFTQDTDIDTEKQVVYVHVPAHRHLPESKVIYEFSTGRILRCTPSIQRCYLSNFNTFKFPNATIMELGWQNLENGKATPQVIDTEEAVEHQDMVVTEKITDLTILTESMYKALGDYSLYREEPLPQGADILEGTLDLTRGTSHLARKKRQWIYCEGNQQPVTRYARTTSHCTRMMMCPKPEDLTHCREHHHTGDDFYRCLCCPSETTPQTCRFGCMLIRD